jgi:hypothetical protein
MIGAPQPETGRERIPYLLRRKKRALVTTIGRGTFAIQTSNVATIPFFQINRKSTRTSEIVEQKNALGEPVAPEV